MALAFLSAAPASAPLAPHAAPGTAGAARPAGASATNAALGVCGALAAAVVVKRTARRAQEMATLPKHMQLSWGLLGVEFRLGPGSKHHFLLGAKAEEVMFHRAFLSAKSTCS